MIFADDDQLSENQADWYVSSETNLESEEEEIRETENTSWLTLTPKSRKDKQKMCRQNQFPEQIENHHHRNAYYNSQYPVEHQKTSGCCDLCKGCTVNHLSSDTYNDPLPRDFSNKCKSKAISHSTDSYAKYTGYNKTIPKESVSGNRKGVHANPSDAVDNNIGYPIHHMKVFHHGDFYKGSSNRMSREKIANRVQETIPDYTFIKPKSASQWSRRRFSTNLPSNLNSKSENRGDNHFKAGQASSRNRQQTNLETYISSPRRITPITMQSKKDNNDTFTLDSNNPSVKTRMEIKSKQNMYVDRCTFNQTNHKHGCMISKFIDNDKFTHTNSNLVNKGKKVASSKQNGMKDEFVYSQMPRNLSSDETYTVTQRDSAFEFRKPVGKPSTSYESDIQLVDEVDGIIASSCPNKHLDIDVKDSNTEANVVVESISTSLVPFMKPPILTLQSPSSKEEIRTEPISEDVPPRLDEIRMSPPVKGSQNMVRISSPSKRKRCTNEMVAYASLNEKNTAYEMESYENIDIHGCQIEKDAYSNESEILNRTFNVEDDFQKNPNARCVKTAFEGTAPIILPNLNQNSKEVHKCISSTPDINEETHSNRTPIVIANHTSMMDGNYLGSCFRCLSAISKASVRKVPLFG